MKNIEIVVAKPINLEQLDGELRSSGYIHFGSSLSAGKLTVHLDDTETKDVQPIVDQHVAQFEDPRASWSTIKAGLPGTATEAFALLAKRLELE